MAYARVSYTGDGSTKIFTVPFPYIDSTHIEIRVGGVLKAVTTDYTWLTSSTIQFVTAPATPKVIYLLRNTPKHTRLVNYQDAAVLREADLDLDSDQSFYIVQEALDAAENTQAIETFVGGVDYTAGSTTALTLGAGDIEMSNILVLFDGAAQHQTEYTEAAGVITFDSAIPTGVLQVQVSYATPLTSGLINGSVTAPTIADLNITEPKLAQAVFNDLTAVAAATGDHVVIADASDSGNKKKTPVSSILSLIASATTAVVGLIRLATNAEAQAGTATDRGVTPANLNATVLGMGQSWQNMTASRALATTYTNTAARPITIQVALTSSTAAAAQLLTTALTLWGSTAAVAGQVMVVSAVVPAGYTYSVQVSAGTGAIVANGWLELR